MTQQSDTETSIIQTLGMDESAGKRKYLKWMIFSIILALVVVIGIILWKKYQSENGITYKTEKAKQGDIHITVTATGTLKPRNKVDISSELSGILQDVFVDYNSQVKIGQVLATLDASKLDAQVLQSKASLETAESRVLQAEATLKESISTLNRQKKVWEISGGKIPSSQDLESTETTVDRARADLSSSRAAVSQEKATLKTRETDLKKTAIRSPINGIVLVRNIEPGQTVASSFQAPVLFTLAENLTQMDLLVNIDEADVGQVNEKQKAIFTVDAYPDRTFEAEISQVRYSATTTSGVVTYEAVLSLNNKDLSLRPGMTATADITIKQVRNVLLVPNAALRFSPVESLREIPSQRPNIINSLMPGPRRMQIGASRAGSNTLPGARNGNIPSGPFPQFIGNGAMSFKENVQQVWILKEDKPFPVRVRTGVTDGAMTEIVSGDLTPGVPVVVGSVSRGEK